MSQDKPKDNSAVGLPPTVDSSSNNAPPPKQLDFPLCFNKGDLNKNLKWNSEIYTFNYKQKNIHEFLNDQSIPKLGGLIQGFVNNGWIIDPKDTNGFNYLTPVDFGV